MGPLVRGNKGNKKDLTRMHLRCLALPRDLSSGAAGHAVYDRLLSCLSLAH